MNYQNSLLDGENQQHTEELSDELMQRLPSNAFWTKLYAICYLIFNIVFAISAAGLISFLPFSLNFGVVFVCILYVGVSFWANIVLFGYSNKLNEFTQSQNLNDFIAAMEKRKLFWQTCVWVVIAVTVLLIIFFFFVISFLINNGFR